MKLNCDLGESFGVWRMGADDDLIPLIDQASVACGFHASDPTHMHRTVQLVQQHGVTLGAHPGYPDLQGFGRRSMQLSPHELQTLIWYQTGALDGIARTLGTRVGYIKPHGALSNDMMRNPAMLRSILQATRAYGRPLSLMIPVTLAHAQHRQMAAEEGVALLFEAFADRAYDADGQLVPRSQPGALLHKIADRVAQARSLTERQGVQAITGEWLSLPADSLCVHGDAPDALPTLTAIRQLLGGRKTL